MNNQIKDTYLKQSYIDSWETYQSSLEQNKEQAKWDFFIITATSESQARAYTMQIEDRLDKGYLSRETKYVVVADPEGKRVGSGGATLNALYEVARQNGLEGENSFKGKRILLVHSGEIVNEYHSILPLANYFLGCLGNYQMEDTLRYLMSLLLL